MKRAAPASKDELPERIAEQLINKIMAPIRNEPLSKFIPMIVIPPMRQQDIVPGVPAMHARLQGSAKKYNYVSLQHTGLKTADYIDDLHPGEEGSKKLARCVIMHAAKAIAAAEANAASGSATAGGGSADAAPLDADAATPDAALLDDARSNGAASGGKRKADCTAPPVKRPSPSAVALPAAAPSGATAGCNSDIHERADSGAAGDGGRTRARRLRGGRRGEGAATRRRKAGATGR